MLQIRIHGRGGQGVVTAAEMLSIAAFEQGRHAQAFPSFGSERTGAPVFYYGPPPGAVVVYDSPDWYNPWLWYDGRWVYRPYPYHRYWGEHYPRWRRR